MIEYLRNKKFTPFLCAAFFLEITLLIIAIDQTFVNNSGDRALTGILAFVAMGIIAFVFFIERLLITRINYSFLKICIVEVILLITAGVLVYKNVLLL